MSELIVLAVFAASLFLCIAFDISVLFALVFGLALFFVYGLVRKHTPKELLMFSLSGIKTVKNILFTFILIGMLTALLRASGAVAYIVYHAIELFDPGIMLVMTFLVCCVISFVTGTAFGTAATVGMICAAMANGMGIPLVYVGGAVLAGSYFGDRCSPMSTSALLVSSLTKTDLFKNILTMLKTSALPFLAACVIYLLLGLGFGTDCDTSSIRSVFGSGFVLHFASLLPIAVMIVLSLFKVNVRITMGISIVCAALICIFLQNMPFSELFKSLFAGFSPADEELFSLLSGGGIFSMVNVFLIVCISSCLSGIFGGTGLLDGAKKAVSKLAGKTTSFFGVMLTSVITGAVACNQTLTVMLTHQLCRETEKDPYLLASHLENTAVVIAPLIPWSIAGAVPLASVGAPGLSVVFAVYLFLLPLWDLALSFYRKRKQQIR